VTARRLPSWPAARPRLAPSPGALAAAARKTAGLIAPALEEIAREAGHAAIDQQVRAEHEDWFRKAAATGIALNASRNGKLQQKRHALAIRMQAREDDYLRFARDPRVPFANNEAERTIRMSKLRIKISGCMRSMTGAQEFCAIRSYLATAARHGISALDALTRAFQASSWIAETG
jgi:transposase